MSLFVLALNLLIVLVKVVSSAYMMKLNISLASAKSLIQIINNSGPRIEPCGTPVVIDKMFDFVLFISVYCLRFINNYVLIGGVTLLCRNIIIC